jgi:hypothetical protein
MARMFGTIAAARSRAAAIEEKLPAAITPTSGSLAI